MEKRVISSELLWGEDKSELRDRIKKAGAKYDWKTRTWEFKSETLYKEVMAELGLAKQEQEQKPSKETQPALSMPMPAPVGAPIMTGIVKPPLPVMTSNIPAPLTTSFDAPPSIPSIPSDIPPAKMPVPEPGPELTAKIIPIKPAPAPVLPSPSLEVATPVTPEQKGNCLSLPPAIIVTMTVQSTGEVDYEKLDGNIDVLEDGEGVRTSKEVKTTRKTVKNIDEYNEARQLANKLRGKIKNCCRILHQGTYLCPIKEVRKLDETISEVKERARAFNAKSRSHFVRISILKAQITGDSEVAAKEIAYNIQILLRDMKQALEDCDVKKIKQIASEAKKVIPIVGSKEGSLLAEAIKEARATASMIKTELGEKGKQIQQVREALVLTQVDKARMAFLEYDIPSEMLQAEKSISAARFEELETTGNEKVAQQNGGIVPNRFEF